MPVTVTKIVTLGIIYLGLAFAAGRTLRVQRELRSKAQKFRESHRTYDSRTDIAVKQEP